MHKCCYIGEAGDCSKPAEWTIVHGPGPDDYTESCTRHVGDMLTDSDEHRVYPIKDEGDEKEKRLRAFLSDLVATCQKHGMAILDQGDDGLALVSWLGWEGDYPDRQTWKHPYLSAFNITPDGFGHDANCPRLIVSDP